MGGDRLHPPRPARGGLPAGVRQTPLPVHRVRVLHVGGLPARLLRAARRDRVRGRAVARPALAARRAGGRDAPEPTRPRRSSPRFWVTRRAPRPPRTTSGSTPSICAAARSTSKMSFTRGKGRGRERADAGRVDRHARRGPPRRRVPVRPPGTGAGAVRRALPPGGLRGRVDHPRSRRGIPLRPPPQGVHDPPRGDHPARPGRTRPPVRLAGVGAADADTP